MPPRPFDDGDRERLVEAARLAGVGRFVSSVAHQLSTPLAAIALRAESLERTVEKLGDSEASARVRRHLKGIHEEAFRCKELLTTLQLFSRPPAAPDDLVDLNALCRHVCILVHHEGLRRQVAVSTHLAESPVRVTGDERRLAQAVLALVHNALNASPEGGVVRLETLARDGRATVMVTDRGEGVPASVAERLFEPLVSSHSPGSALGLGLMACQAIATAHRGTLRWEALADGGTRFALTLPSGVREDS